jgi:predicted TIM-barrel fold metal-dependent hydrolase
MHANPTRRSFLAAAGAVVAAARPRPDGLLIDTHIHLFAADQRRFPYHPNATYKPPSQDLEPYKRFVREQKIDHGVLVHPEPYQDDHSYLEYCFSREPWAGFFKGTCLFDPIDPKTPERMEALVKRNPGRIVALRIHAMAERGAPPTTSGAIKNRDLRDPKVKVVWRKAADLGLAIQLHFLPYFAPQIEALASELRGVPVILDHLGRAGMGTKADYRAVLELARLPKTYMKFSGVRYSSKQEPPYLDAQPIVKQAFEHFGPDRMIWGGLGYDRAAFEQNVRTFDALLDFASEEDKAKIRGLTAKKLFGFGG